MDESAAVRSTKTTYALFNVPQMPPKTADSNGCYGHTPKFTSGARPLYAVAVTSLFINLCFAWQRLLSAILVYPDPAITLSLEFPRWNGRAT